VIPIGRFLSDLGGPVVAARPRSAPTSCGYCRDDLDAASTWRCPRCATLHHRACVREHGRCTVFGCGAAFREMKIYRGPPRGRFEPDQALRALLFVAAIFVGGWIVLHAHLELRSRCSLTLAE
jgi:hypothetical protein